MKVSINTYNITKQQKSKALSGGRGFTIVELLIVVVVVAILAAITIVSYNGITNRAHDTAVQSDIRNLGDKVSQYVATIGSLPLMTQSPNPFVSMGAKVSKQSYGAHFRPEGGEYNLLYCPDLDNLNFAFVAGSKSGKTFYFSSKEGGAREGSSPLVTYVATCSNYGISSGNSGAYIPVWIYSNGMWQPWV